MKSFLLRLIVEIMLVALVVFGAIYYLQRPVDIDKLPALKSGDIVFHTSVSRQSPAIIWATKSLYSHTGVLQKVGEDWLVFEAGGKADGTPFLEWVGKGALKRFTVMRYPGLSESENDRLLSFLLEITGRPYDWVFLFDNVEIYCSELVYLAFDSVGVRLGEIEKVWQLDVDNFLVEDIIKERWSSHPLCTNDGEDYLECKRKIYEQPLITPVSIVEDEKLEFVYSNYY